MTKKAIASAREGCHRIVVVSDGSPWELPDVEFHEFFDGYDEAMGLMRLIEYDKNGGYPKAVNIGIKDSAAPHYLILNNDATLEPGCINAMLFEHKKIKEGVVTATEIGRDTRTPSGACWLVDRATWDKYGPLDESFLQGAGEETDFWLRLKANNIKVTRCPEARFHHLKSATLKRTPSHKEQFRKNMATLRQRWGTDIFLLDNATNAEQK